MKKVFFALAIASACYACGGGDTKETTPVSTNDSNANSQIGGSDTGSASTSATPAAPAVTSTPSGSGPDGKALIAASDCLTCHKEDAKVIGPSYQDVAKKYENNAENVKLLSEKVMKGGQGVWGQIPMSPHPNLSQTDAEAMVKYILSLKK
ncbi:c-type cytochrome [Pollutibacter soli]|uniref:c-type cytochrome n=1 Tax=Pollutibacter soli TaxID=3034157 RepID=UPI0030140614